MSPRRGAALVIGISSYRQGGGLAPLPMARLDARAVARLFADPAVCGFPRESVSLLTDEKAVRSRIVRRLSGWLPDQARDAELAIIYFAGHGTTDRVGGKEEGYLLPHDADRRQVKDRGVAMADLVEWMANIEAESLVVILDCCHAGGLIASRDGGSVQSQLRELVIPPSILHRLTGQGRFLMASCGEGEKSVELAELGHGLFTHYLIQGIRKEGDANGDGWVGLTELSHYVAGNVERHAQLLGHMQRPWTEGKWSKEVRISRTGVPAAPGPADSRTRLERLWDEEGPDKTIYELEREFQEYDEGRLLDALRFIGEKKTPKAVPLVFRLLADQSKAVRMRAREVLRVIGWQLASAAVQDLIRHPDEERIGFVLEGLAALESDDDVVLLLDHLSRELKGKLKDRAFFLHARKRAARDEGRVAALFRAKKMPYEITRAFGEGVFTTAYLGRPRRGDRPVVVRMLRPEFAGQKFVRDQFMALAGRWLEYVHQNLVRVRDFNCDEDGVEAVYYVVRDYLDGPTLREVLQNKVFEPLQVVKIVRQALAALTPVHEDGRAHCGLRSSNLFVLSNGRVVLGDPSLPLPLLTTDPRRLSFDYRYMPPETFGELGPRSDFYSLGCVAYELACGRPPFDSDNHHQLIAMHLRDPVPPLLRDGRPLGRAWEEFLSPLLEKSPERRYRDLDTAMEALDRLARTLRPWDPGDPAVGASFEPKGPIPAPDPGVGVTPGQPAGGPGSFPVPLKPFTPPAPSSPAQPPWRFTNSLLGENSLREYREPETVLPMGGDVSATQAPPGGASIEDLPAHSEGGTDSFPILGRSFPDATPIVWAGRYRLIEEIGRGGMGVVYRARHVDLQRDVAIKMVIALHYHGPEVIRRLHDEAMVIAKLSHPNIVPIYDFGEEQGLPYIVMPFVTGGTLSRLVEEAPMAERTAVGIALQVADALDHAHRVGIVHRDIKPSNILLTDDETPQVSDFGLAKGLQQDDGVTPSGAILGTPMYMSPEQAMGQRDVGVTSDVYSLGATLYQMLTGRPPFHGRSLGETLHQVLDDEPTSPRRLNSAVSRDLEVICLKCLQKDPKRRYATAAHLKEDLARYLESRPILARPTGTIGRLQRWARRNPLVALLTSLLMILLMTIFSLIYIWVRGLL